MNQLKLIPVGKYVYLLKREKIETQPCPFYFLVHG